MKPHRKFLGESLTPVLTVDDAGPEPASLIALASEFAPYPPAGNNYPGLRRILSEADTKAWTYVVCLLEAMTSFIAGAFDLDGFELVEASFSLITTPPERLAQVQCAPHFDSVDRNFYAVLHYLSDCEGTAFYRHRATGLELITPDRLDAYVALARSQTANGPRGYISGSTPEYESIGMIEGKAGRLAVYPGSLLHSGIIPSDFVGSSDPRSGRLTCNMFIRGRRDRQAS